MAMTSGVRTIDGLSLATKGSSARRFSSRPQKEPAGDHTSGCRRPRAIALSASFEFIAFIETNTRLPATCSPEALNFATAALSSCSFSGETTNDSCWAPDGAAVDVLGVLEPDFPPPPPPPPDATTAATTTAATAARMVRIEPVFTGSAQRACSRTRRRAATHAGSMPVEQGGVVGGELRAHVVEVAGHRLVEGAQHRARVRGGLVAVDALALADAAHELRGPEALRPARRREDQAAQVARELLGEDVGLARRDALGERHEGGVRGALGARARQACASADEVEELAR